MSTVPTILDFVTDPQLLGLAVSPAQRVLLKSIYGQPLAAGEVEVWRQCTGRAEYPGHPFTEVTVVAGARAGKDSRIAVPIALYEAIFGGHEGRLGKGEMGVVPLVAQDEKATRVAFAYCRDYVTGSPVLKRLVDEIRESEIRLTNRMRIVCFACTAKSLRGWSIPAAILDELAFFRLEAGAEVDAEVQAALRRGMVGFPSARLVKISTPYAKNGILFDDFQKYWGQASADVLVWRASTALMNPAIDPLRLAREQRVDGQRFAREYLGEFSEDVETFLPQAWIDQAVVEGRHELPPQRAVDYVAAVDPSGGGVDAFTLAIVHGEGEGAERRVVQDVMKGWASSRREKVDLTAVVAEIAECCGWYHVSEVVGDRYAAEWVRQSFERAGLAYREAEMDRSRVYLEAEPRFAQGRIELLDHPAMVRELSLLERRPRAGGKTQVDHPKGGHDDFSNALCLAVTQLGGESMGLPLYRFRDEELDGAVAAEHTPEELAALE